MCGFGDKTLPQPTKTDDLLRKSEMASERQYKRFRHRVGVRISKKEYRRKQSKTGVVYRGSSESSIRSIRAKKPKFIYQSNLTTYNDKKVGKDI
jgi:hypothetical protein